MKILTKPMRTTTLVVETNIDYSRLQNTFKLVRYSLPDQFRFASNRYKKLHNHLKEQLTHPYQYFEHDELEQKQKPVVYVLYPHQEKIQELTLEFISDVSLSHVEIEFNKLKLHVLLKLLQASYFKSNKQPAFVSQGSYYVYVKSAGNYFHKCLEIRLRGDVRNEDTSEEQLFKITGHSTTFRPFTKDRIEEGWKRIYPYFKKMSPKDGLVFFNQLRPDEIDTYDGEIFGIFPDRSFPLDFHSQSNLEHSRGKILFDFIRNFTQYLRDYGLNTRSRMRDFHEYKPNKKATDLPLQQLNTVWLFDNRFEKEAISIETYRTALSAEYPVKFEIINQIPSDFKMPVLLLQDCNPEDFESGGLLFGEKDPYKIIYNDPQYMHTPKQSINVNQNDAEKCLGDKGNYLTYKPIFLAGANKKAELIKFKVTLNQLYLKDIIMNRSEIIGKLPFVANLQNYAFIRKKTYEDKFYGWVLFYIKDNQPYFVDLRTPEGKDQLHMLAKSYDLDWDEDVEIALSTKHRRIDREKEADRYVQSYDIIIGQGQVIELEDIDERVLYEYDQIEQRQSEFSKAYPIEKFKLAHYYPKFKSTTITLEQLEAFDDFLDDLLSYEISFNDLTSGESMERIAEILHIEKSENGRYSRRKLLALYSKLKMFLSPKSKEVQASSGIWYDQENCFMVGSFYSLEDTQPTANLIRQLDVFKGGESFDIKPFLEAAGVKFVRYQQYTVYPYPFYLIDVYVENVLQDPTTM